MLYVFYGIIGAAACVMVYGLILGIKLRSVAKLAPIKQAINLLLVLIGFFLLAYLIAPLAPGLSRQSSLILMSVVFFFGAIYVVLVLGLIKKLIHAVQEMLEYQSTLAETPTTDPTTDIADSELPELPELPEIDAS